MQLQACRWLGRVEGKSLTLSSAFICASDFTSLSLPKAHILYLQSGNGEQAGRGHVFCREWKQTSNQLKLRNEWPFYHHLALTIPDTVRDRSLLLKHSLVALRFNIIGAFNGEFKYLLLHQVHTFLLRVLQYLQYLLCSGWKLNCPPQLQSVGATTRVDLESESRQLRTTGAHTGHPTVLWVPGFQE